MKTALVYIRGLNTHADSDWCGMREFIRHLAVQLAADVIDLDYGPPSPSGGANPNYHHTLDDTMEHISKQSLQVVGDVALALITQ